MPLADRTSWFERIRTVESQLSIQGKIQLLFILAVILCVLVSLPLVLFETLSFKKHFDRSTADILVKIIEPELSDQMLRIDLPAIEATVNTFREALGVQTFCLLNKEKIVVKSFVHTCELSSIPFLVPIRSTDRGVTGYLYAQVLDSNANSIIYSQIIVAGSLIATFFIVSFLMLLRLQAIISRPLEELSSSVTQFVNTNDFHIRASRFADDEIGRLATAFNHLLQEMRVKEHALIKAKNKADEANELKGDFLASVSHEIRTPMNGIIGTTELLLESLEKQKHKNYASTVLRSSESLLAIINDILDFSKIESGKLEIESIPFNLYAEVEDVADLMTMRANEKDIEIILAISPYIPEVVIGDPSRLRQILNNLVNNAIKFTSSGHILIAVEPLGAEHGNDNEEALRFSVTDTGVGISDEAQKKIFERFTQAESSITRQYGGTGLGLAICKQLVELLGGSIQVESTEGQGSTFSFTLHLLIDSSQPHYDNCDDLENLNALVVDDNPYFLEYIKLALRYFGLRVACVSSAKEALRLIGQYEAAGDPFNIVLIDENIPMVNGCALAENIGLTYVDTAPPIIILNNISADIQHEQAYIKLGISACIQKPIRLRQLTALIGLTVSSAKVGDKVGLLTVDEIRGGANNRSSSLQLAGPKVLVAEVNDIHYKLIESLLLGAGSRVARVLDGESVIEYSRQHSIDLLIVDVELPIVNGIDVARAFKKIQSEMGGAHTPIIATSAKDIDINHVHSLNAGVDLFLHKQSLKNQLVSKVAVLIPDFIVNQKNDLVYFSNVNIMLVEDNRVNAQITTEILQEFGCEVALSVNGKEAFESFREKRFDAVLMDCQMPIMDGFESTRHIRHFEKSAQRAPTPIIALTANAMKGDSERCFNAGMDDYITKPIRREKLRFILANCIDSEKISIKHLADSEDEHLVDEEEFSRILEFGGRAGVDVERYVVDIEKSFRLLERQFRAQPARVIYDTAKIIVPICEALGLLRLKRDVSRFAQAALDLHVAKVNRTDALSGVLETCIQTIVETKGYIKTLQDEIVVTLPQVVDDLPPQVVYEGDGNAQVGSLSNDSEDKNPVKKSAIKVFTSKENDSHLLIDYDVFNATKKVFKKKFITILGEYVEDSEEYLSEIRLGVDEQDYNRIRESAHPLKSSSYTLGFCAVGDFAKKIELYAKQSSNLDEIDQQLIALVDSFSETKAFIDTIESEPC